MVCGPAPAMLKWMKSGTLTLRLAARIAARNEPGPLSSVLVTRLVAPRAGFEQAATNRPATTSAAAIESFTCCVFMAIDSSTARPLVGPMIGMGIWFPDEYSGIGAARLR